MAHATINIGLARKGKPDLLPGVALMLANRAAGDVHITCRVGQSATERTLVAVYDDPFTPEQLYALAVELEQDAIVQLTSDGVGTLAGPAVEKWGDFDPASFLEMRVKEPV